MYLGEVSLEGLCARCRDQPRTGKATTPSVNMSENVQPPLDSYPAEDRKTGVAERRWEKAEHQKHARTATHDARARQDSHRAADGVVYTSHSPIYPVVRTPPKIRIMTIISIIMIMVITMLLLLLLLRIIIIMIITMIIIRIHCINKN